MEPLRRARELHERKAELVAAGGSAGEVGQVWAELAALEQHADDAFPLSAADADALRAALQTRVLELHTREVAAHEQVGRVLG